MPPTQLLLVLVSLLATTQTIGPGEQASGSGGASPAAMGSAPMPTTLAVPDGYQRATPTVSDLLDEDSGFRVTHRQRLELAGLLAFGAGLAFSVLGRTFVEFVRSVVRWLDEVFADQNGEPNRARRQPNPPARGRGRRFRRGQ